MRALLLSCNKPASNRLATASLPASAKAWRNSGVISIACCTAFSADQLAFTFEGKIPETAGLVFTYSKSPSSLLHGTFLERIAKRLTRIDR